MARRISFDDRTNVASALDQAIKTAAQKGETSSAFGYVEGTPQKFVNMPDRRFAGDELLAGLNGTFGRATEDPRYRDYFKRFTGRLFGGAYAPGSPEPASEVV